MVIYPSFVFLLSSNLHYSYVYSMLLNFIMLPLNFIIIRCFLYWFDYKYLHNGHMPYIYNIKLFKVYPTIEEHSSITLICLMDISFSRTFISKNCFICFNLIIFINTVTDFIDFVNFVDDVFDFVGFIANCYIGLNFLAQDFFSHEFSKLCSNLDHIQVINNIVPLDFTFSDLIYRIAKHHHRILY